jgi:hypothetical protein
VPRLVFWARNGRVGAYDGLWNGISSLIVGSLGALHVLSVLVLGPDGVMWIRERS